MVRCKCVIHQLDEITSLAVLISKGLIRWYGTDTLHLDKDTITRAAQLLSLRLFHNSSMACGQSDNVTIQADVFDRSGRS